MKFEFEKGYEVGIERWNEVNENLERNLKELVNTKVLESEVITYIQDMCAELEGLNSSKCDNMLFLMYDKPESMPADARVDYVYRPTYLAATIMMTAFCRYETVRGNENMRVILKKTLNASMGRGFVGAGYEEISGLMDTLQLFAEGDTMKFVECYPEINEKFVAQLVKAITFLETEICTGKVKDAWSGKDYSERGKEILFMLKKSYIEEYDYVWYACYGSNLCKERFVKYINNCSNKTLPMEDRPFMIPYNIYFAKNSLQWRGGKAFLDDTEEGMAYGRIYKITKEQYEEIKAQEGNDYRKKLKFGMCDDVSVYSFTDTQKNEESRLPSPKYFSTMLAGLKECYEGIIEEYDLVKYLISAMMPETAFVVVKEIKNNPHYLSIREIVERSGLNLEQVREAINWLMEHQVIQQDRRSVRDGHQISDENAYFYTVDNENGRQLISVMIDALVSTNNGDEEDDINNSGHTITAEREGNRRYVYASRIERSQKNRINGIALHGYKCQVCGFDFLETYGEIGRNYIEVHHVNPIAEQDGEVEVNPATDLVCVCANCHRMIHRKRNHTLTISELKKLLP